jgi:hypothetical protein
MTARITHVAMRGSGLSGEIWPSIYDLRIRQRWICIRVPSVRSQKEQSVRGSIRYSWIGRNSGTNLISTWRTWRT